MKSLKESLKALALPLLATALLSSAAGAATAHQLQADSQAALEKLYAANPKTRELGQKAYATLVFPTVIRAGLLMAGFERGDGVLFVKGQVDGYYNTTSACPGLQAGAQTYSYVLFFMTPDDLKDLKKSGGLNLGAAPGLTVADKGVAGGASLYTLQGIKAFVFGQKGLMANIGFKATKISQYTPSE